MNDFVAIAIHDAKNALTALNTWLQAAQRQAPSPALDQARLIAAQLSAQMVELLTLYRADNGLLRINVDDRDLGDFLEELRTELTPSQTPDIAVIWPTKHVADIGTWAFDAVLVKFVLLDALRNAARHGATRIELNIRNMPGAGLEFSILDDGPGYGAEVLAGHLPEPDSATGATGLGLRFARLVAEHHRTPDGRQGQLRLSNAAGARFSLLLP